MELAVPCQNVGSWHSGWGLMSLIPSRFSSFWQLFLLRNVELPPCITVGWVKKVWELSTTLNIVNSVCFEQFLTDQWGFTGVSSRSWAGINGYFLRKGAKRGPFCALNPLILPKMWYSRCFRCWSLFSPFLPFCTVLTWFYLRLGTVNSALFCRFEQKVMNIPDIPELKPK